MCRAQLRDYRKDGKMLEKAHNGMKVKIVSNEHGGQFPIGTVGTVGNIFKWDGCVIIVMFLGEILWRSDEDDRETIELKNAYEPLCPFLIKKI
jgi:hypothetical protein